MRFSAYRARLSRKRCRLRTAWRAAVLSKLEEALARLNQMREEEGRGTERELRQRMGHVQQAREGVEKHRQAALQTYADRLRTRLQELFRFTN